MSGLKRLIYCKNSQQDRHINFGVVEMHIKQMVLVSQMLDSSIIKFVFSPWPSIVKLVFYFSRNYLKCIYYAKWERPVVMLKKLKDVYAGV